MPQTIKRLGTTLLQRRLRGFSHTIAKVKEVTPTSNRTSSSKPDTSTKARPLPSFNPLQQIRESRPAVRYTVYAGLGLMVTVEAIFWLNVLRAKFFPSTSKENNQNDAELLERLRDAVKGYRTAWMSNYGRYYGAYLWGLGYGGLDGLQNERS